MNDKSVCEFRKMWSLHAFCLKAMKKMIHSLVRIDFCIAECVNSFENVASVLSNACLKKL